MLKEEFLDKIEELQNKIKNCKDDFEAVNLQKELIDYLTDKLSNKEDFVKDILGQR